MVLDYRPDTNVIVCDGSYGQERDYMKYTPMTKWSIRAVGDGTDALSLTDMDFSGFQGTMIKFLCDFTWSGI